MSVQGLKNSTGIDIQESFNTSYVSVQVVWYRLFNTLVCVSIHPMCRFKYESYKLSLIAKLFQYILCVGSSERFVKNINKSKEFQYILCVGSRELFWCFALFPLLFQYILCVGSSCVTIGLSAPSAVSIHPMCRFKKC